MRSCEMGKTITETLLQHVHSTIQMHTNIYMYLYISNTITHNIYIHENSLECRSNITLWILNSCRLKSNYFQYLFGAVCK